MEEDLDSQAPLKVSFPCPCCFLALLSLSSLLATGALCSQGSLCLEHTPLPAPAAHLPGSFATTSSLCLLHTLHRGRRGVNGALWEGAAASCPNPNTSYHVTPVMATYPFSASV